MEMAGHTSESWRTSITTILLIYRIEAEADQAIFTRFLELSQTRATRVERAPSASQPAGNIYGPPHLAKTVVVSRRMGTVMMKNVRFSW